MLLEPAISVDLTQFWTLMHKPLNPDVLDVKQFAGYINVGYRTALKIVHENRVHHVKLGKRGVRISREAADTFLNLSSNLPRALKVTKPSAFARSVRKTTL